MKCASILIYAVGLLVLPTFASEADDSTRRDALRQQYEFVKQIFLRLDNPEDDRFRIDNGMLELGSCFAGSPAYGSTKNNAITIDNMISLRLVVLVFETTPKLAGFPDGDWVSLVNTRERQVLDVMIDNALRFSDTDTKGLRTGLNDEGPAGFLGDVFIHNLAEKLNTYRSGNPNLPFVTVASLGCGAGSVGIKLKLNPATSGSQLFYMTDFLYQLCQAQKRLLTDVDHCPWWEEAPEELVSYLSGDYRYLARWPDGTQRAGKFSVDDDKMEGNTLTFDKSAP